MVGTNQSLVANNTDPSTETEKELCKRVRLLTESAAGRSGAGDRRSQDPSVEATVCLLSQPLPVLDIQLHAAPANL